MRALKTKSGRLMTGEIVEHDRYYEVTGMYLDLTMQDAVVAGAAPEWRFGLAPFAPVGPGVQTMRVPLVSVEGEITLPPILAQNVGMALAAERQNAARRAQTLSMRVTAKPGLSPEETIALVAQQAEKDGRLPTGDHATDTNHGIVGSFRVKETSPYRGTK